MFSIVIPLYNEGENIQFLLEEIFINLKKFNNYEIILINDSSTDQTVSLISQIKNSKIKLINNSINKGQSFSIYRGIQEASFEIIVTLDGDGQNDPADIPNLLKKYISNNDTQLVGGIRLKRQDNIIKIVSSRIANYIRMIILKDNCKDTGCSLKVFNKHIFLSFPFFDGIHRFLPALFIGFGYKTFFINVNHRRRKFGVSKYGTVTRLFKGIRDLYIVKKIIKNKNK